ncbi:MAG: hypothetical protein ING29_14630 [Azospirillum sp.]|nr:hypothetical protein [Azospirillum sp.]
MRLVVLIAAIGLFAAGPVGAQGSGDQRPNSTPPKANPDSEKLNQRNPNVFHAGPGRPLEGSVYVAPSRQVKPDAKK